MERYLFMKGLFISPGVEVVDLLAEPLREFDTPPTLLDE